MAKKPQPIPAGGTDATRTRGRRARSTGDDNGGGGTSSERADERLTALLEQFGGGGFRVLVERTDATSTVEYMGPVDFTSELYETVRQRWGGGLYGGRIVDQRSKYKARIIPFRVGGPPRTAAFDDTTAHAPALPSGLEAVLQGINANLAALNASARAPAVDPVDHVVKIARALRETSAGNQTAAAPDSISMMREMYGFMRELREESAPGKPESDFGTVMREGVGPLVQVLNRKLDIDQQRERRRSTSSTPATTGSTAAPVAIQPPAREESVIPSDELAALLLTIPKPARAFLLGCAERDDEAEDYVPMLLNQLTDDAYDAMVRNLPRADFVDVLISVIPAYGQHREWFTTLVDALRTTVAAAILEGDGGQAAPDAQGVDGVEVEA